MKLIDLTGKRFGHWTVLCRAVSKTKQTMWHCRCDCGNEVDVNGSSLRRGISTQCKSCHGRDNADKRRQELTGEKFGRLTVGSRAPDKKGRTWWHCKCECGNEIDVSAHHLLAGRTQSCGCLQKERARHALFKDLTGQRFGRLYVLELSGKHSGSCRNKTTYWKCKCDCGNVVDVRSSLLIRGDAQSCGCLQKERASEASFHDITGQHFGMLTAMYRTTDKQNCYGRSIVVWHCKCDCGNETDVRANDLTYGNVLSCGCLISYGEEQCQKFLEQHELIFERNKVFSKLRGHKGRYLPYDFYIPEYNLLIEIQGAQHYRKIFHMTDEDMSQREYYDFLKYQYAQDNQFDILYLKWDKQNMTTNEFLFPLREYIENIEQRTNICHQQMLNYGGAFVERYDIANSSIRSVSTY